MNEKKYIKIGNKTINISSINSIEFSDSYFSVNILIGQPIYTYKFKFNDEKEFIRFKAYIRMISTEFEAVDQEG